jgi:hypothetical protein
MLWCAPARDFTLGDLALKFYCSIFPVWWSKSIVSTFQNKPHFLLGMKHDELLKKNAPFPHVHCCFFPQLGAFAEYIGINSHTESISISISNHSEKRNKALVLHKPESVSTATRLPAIHYL